MKRAKVRATAAAAFGAAALVLSSVSALAPADAAPSGKHVERVCTTTPAAGHATCYAEHVVNASGASPHYSAPPATGMTPAKIQDAYNLTGLSSGGKTVAIVDAYGYPNLERDLGVYRSQFGLSACTKANGCLTVMNQSGGSSLPAFNLGWAGETALDVDAVSAACPDCKILVVEANSTSFTDLGAAVNTAAKQPGVVAISNSYGTDGGDAPDSTYGSYYNHPGIAVTASTGDKGYQGGSFPASSAYTTAVGGTTLTAASNSRGWNETAWSGAGSGCSDYNAKPSFQDSGVTGCSNKAMADVSAAGDPNDGGLAIYLPTNKRSSTWDQYGGTSESSPLIAAVYALGTNTISGNAAALPWTHQSSLFDVTSGSNGSCPTTQWCNARTGWDGPTGLGTPNGAGAF